MRVGGPAPSDAEVAGFVALIMAEDMEQARAIADRVVVHYGSREALLDDLLAPAARLLGEMWERDDCDFLTVTLGVYRLDQIMKETAMRSGRRAGACALGRRRHGRSYCRWCGMNGSTWSGCRLRPSGI
jgi:hypothetical protein